MVVNSVIRGSLVMLVGFGVGYSWSATLIEWPYLGYQKVM
jgi:3-oxoacyl-[acyl-carrier-protein] synthase III